MVGKVFLKCRDSCNNTAINDGTLLFIIGLVRFEEAIPAVLRDVLNGTSYQSNINVGTQGS